MTGAQPWLQRVSVVVLAITIVLFACGSSSVRGVLTFGSHARWVGLFVLCGVAFLQGGLGQPTRPARLFLALLGVTTGLGALALLSATWSVAPRITAERSITVIVLFVAGASLAYAVSAEPRIWPWVLNGILAGAVIVCLLGLVVLAVARHDAVQWESPGQPARFRGLGQNPNTVSMLAAIGMPIAFWLVVSGRERRVRIAGALALLLLFGTIATSNSRGAVLATMVALVVYGAGAFTWSRARAAVIAFVLLLAAASYGVFLLLPTQPLPGAGTAQQQQTHQPGAGAGGASGSASGGASGGASGSGAGGDVLPVTGYFPGGLFNEVGRPLYGPGGEVARKALGTSGRIQAWKGALRQGDQRPVLGFGFGTEERVFVDRYYTFIGERPENSWLGLYLQLGVVGVAVLLAVFLILVAAYVAVLRAPPSADRSVAAVCAGVVAAGLVLTMVQSYIYSVGNIASVSFWVCAFLLTIAATRRGRTQEATS
jgi:hypothetical protein